MISSIYSPWFTENSGTVLPLFWISPREALDDRRVDAAGAPLTTATKEERLVSMMRGICSAGIRACPPRRPPSLASWRRRLRPPVKVRDTAHCETPASRATFSDDAYFFLLLRFRRPRSPSIIFPPARRRPASENSNSTSQHRQKLELRYGRLLAICIAMQEADMPSSILVNGNGR